MSYIHVQGSTDEQIKVNVYRYLNFFIYCLGDVGNYTAGTKHRHKWVR